MQLNGMSLKEKILHPLNSLIILLSIFLAIVIILVIIIETRGNLHHGAEITQAQEESLKEPSRRKPPTTGAKKSPKICKTKECITLANHLINWRDTRVDPCKNFYKAACGNFIRHSLTSSRFDHKDETIEILLHTFLSKNETSDSLVENVARIYYQKCESMKSHFDEDQQLGYENIIEDIQKIGKWPMLDEDWDESTFDLNVMLVNMAKLYSHDFGFFHFNIFDSEKLVISGISDIDFLDSSFKKKVTDVLKTKNSKLNKKKLKQAFKNVQGLISSLNVIQGNDTKVPLLPNFKELERLVPVIDFRKIIDAFAPDTVEGKIMADRVRNEAEVEKSEIFRNNNLEKILKSTPKLVVANFLILKYIYNTLFLLVPHDVSEVQDIDCSKDTIEAFPKSVVIIFARYYFEKTNLKLVSALVEDVRKTFVEYLNESTWLHEKTKKNAIVKVMKIRKMIGYPDSYESPEMDEMLEAIDINFGDSYYSIKRKRERYMTEQYMDFFSKKELKSPDYQLLEPRAFYNKRQNSLSVTAARIDDPLFDETLPEYANIASLGHTIGHEIGHSFGPEAMDLNEDGQRHNWWSPDDMALYKKKSDCLVEQCNQYHDPDYGTNRNGKRKLSEMIADNHGMEVSWRLFKKTNYSHASKLPGFENYSTERLFFHIYALNRCSYYQGKSKKKEKEAKHPIQSFRVNAVLSNFKAFAEVFNCKEGAPMNPTDKIHAENGEFDFKI